MVPAGQVVAKPPVVRWEVAGALPVIGTTAWSAVHAVQPGPGEVIVVAGAAGGVGGIAAQLAVRSGARTIGVASVADHEWLRSLGVEPLAPGDDLAAHLQALADRTDAFIDTVGHGYVHLAVDLGVVPQRIDTTIDFPAARETGAKTDGNAAGSRPEVLEELLGLIAEGALEVPIARTFPLREVRAAFTYLEGPHGRGKVVLTNA